MQQSSPIYVLFSVTFFFIKDHWQCLSECFCADANKILGVFAPSSLEQVGMFGN